MSIHKRVAFFLILLTIPLYLLSLWLVSRTVLGEISLRKMNEKGLLSAVSYDSRNATYHYLLGRFYQYNSDAFDPDKAISHYQESIRLSPLQGGCWLDLSKAYQTAGMEKEAGRAIERALRLDPRNPEVIWEAGLFYLISGNLETAVKNLREVILLRPERQETIYDLLWKIELEPEYIIKEVVPDSYPYYKRYFLYLISTGRVSESHDLWRTMARFPVEDELFVRYTDFLISRRLYEDAEQTWRDFVGKKFAGKTEDQPSLIWNGSFEFDMQNGGLDWKIGKTKGAMPFLDSDIHISGGRSLGVSFDGKHNPDITVASQVVRVVPGANYLLRGYARSDSLTTTNGVFISVEGHKCKGLYKKSEVITGNNFWRDITVEFETPPECGAVSIKIRREKSEKLDNKISGTAWVDGISLMKRS
ncbi:MAG: hypothetical protein FJ242_03665 [Nitrospira sp.]|nr:hypothetical protein [Nitrospira sp.]